MASIKFGIRAPRAPSLKAPTPKVPKTSGQGTSRKSYQEARSLGQKGTGLPGFKPVRLGTQAVKDKRSYGKSSGFQPASTPFNVDFGDTMDPTNEAGMWPAELK